MLDRKGLERLDEQKFGHLKIGNLFKNVLNPEIEVLKRDHTDDKPK